MPTRIALGDLGVDVMGPLAQGSQLWFGDLLDNARVGIWGMEHKQKRHDWEEGREGGKVFFGGVQRISSRKPTANAVDHEEI